MLEKELKVKLHLYMKDDVGLTDIEREQKFYELLHKFCSENQEFSFQVYDMEHSDLD
jgi:hypothetical protein